MSAKTDNLKVQAVARVLVTVEVRASCWGGDCSIAQLYQQAAESGLEQVRQACSMTKGQFRLIDAKVTGVITEQTD